MIPNPDSVLNCFQAFGRTKSCFYGRAVHREHERIVVHTHHLMGQHLRIFEHRGDFDGAGPVRVRTVATPEPPQLKRFMRFPCRVFGQHTLAVTQRYTRA